MKTVGTLCRRLDQAVPSLKYYAASFWWVWNFTCYGGFIWTASPQITANHLSSVNVISTLSLIVACAVFAFLQKSQKLLNRDLFLLAGGLLGSIGTVILLFIHIDFDEATYLLYLAGVLTGLGSGILIMKIAQYYGTLQPKTSLGYTLKAATLTILIYFVITGSPSVIGSSILVMVFIITAILLITGNHTEVAANEDPSQYLNPSPIMWRFLSLVFVSFFFTEFSRFSFTGLHSISEMYRANSIAAIAIISIFLICLIALLLIKKQPGFTAIYYPFTFIILAVLTVLTIIGSNSLPSVCVSSTCSFILQTQIFSIFALISFSSKSSPYKVFGAGFCFIGIGSTLGSFIGNYSKGLPESAVFRIGFGFIILVVFVVFLLLIFTRKHAHKLLAEIPDEEVESQVQIDNEFPKPWRNRLDEVCRDFNLSPRESEVFRLLVRGHGIKYISERLVVSIYTTRAHTRNIYVKTGVHTREQLMNLLNKLDEG